MTTAKTRQEKTYVRLIDGVVVEVVDGHGEVVGGIQEAGIRVRSLGIIWLHARYSNVFALESGSVRCDILQVTDGESGLQCLDHTEGQKARPKALPCHAARRFRWGQQDLETRAGGASRWQPGAVLLMRGRKLRSQKEGSDLPINIYMTPPLARKMLSSDTQAAKLTW